MPGAARDFQRVFMNAVWLLLAYILPRLFTVGSVVIAARVLGTRDFGAYGTAAAYAVIMSIFATLGMMPLLIRDIAREPASGARLLAAANVVKTCTNFVMLIALWVLATRVFHYSPLTVRAALLLGIAYAIAAYAENFAAYFQAIERMHVWMQASALCGLVSGILGAALVVSTRSMVWFCVAAIAGQLASLGWLLFRCPAHVRGGSSIYSTDVKRLLRALAPFAAAFVVLTIFYKADVLVLASLRTAEEVGEYTAAYKFVDIAQALLIVVAGAVYPRLSRAGANGQADWSGTRLTELMLLFAVPICALLWLLRAPLIHLAYGSAYQGSTLVFAFLAPALPALTINILAGYVLGAKGKMGLVAVFYTAAAIVKLTLDFALISRYGARGAGMAMLASEAALAAGFLVTMRVAAASSPSLLEVLRRVRVERAAVTVEGVQP